MTQIYTEIRKKTELSGSDCDQDVNTCTVGTTVEIASFYYEIPSVEEERYVDFKGTWAVSEICQDGLVSNGKYVFDDIGMTFTGTECTGGTSTEIVPETHTYAGLATLDYWWFNQQERTSQATLTELNSVVRFCDIEVDEGGYTPGTACIDNQLNDKTIFVKWNYQPAGKNWDEGLLIRHKFSKTGNFLGTMTMQKVK